MLIEKSRIYKNKSYYPEYHLKHCKACNMLFLTTDSKRVYCRSFHYCNPAKIKRNKIFKILVKNNINIHEFYTSLYWSIYYYLRDHKLINFNDIKKIVYTDFKIDVSISNVLYVINQLKKFHYLERYNHNKYKSLIYEGKLNENRYE